MDTLEKKLETDNSIVTAQIFSQIFEAACETKTQKSALEFLKAKSKSDNPLVSETAAEIIIKLAQQNAFDIKSMLAEFTTLTTSTRHNNGTIRIIINLFVLYETRMFEKTKVLPKLSLSQHPLVKILMDNVSVQAFVFNELVQSYRTYLRFSSLVTKLNEPLFLYIMCHPGLRFDLNFIRENLWMFILNNLEASNTDMIFKILCWLPTENSDNLLVNSTLLIKLLETCFEKFSTEEQEIIILKLLSVLHQLILKRENCKTLLQALKEVFLKVYSLVTVNVALLVLSETILICPFIYLSGLLEICYLLIKTPGVSSYSNYTVKFASLVWIANPSTLTDNAKSYLNDIVSVYADSDSKFKTEDLENLSKKYVSIIESDTHISENLHYCVRIKSLKNLSPWLEKLDNAPMCFLKKKFFLLCGLSLDKTLNYLVHKKLFALIIKCVKADYNLAFSGLVLVFYQLADPYYSQIHFNLLQELPNMACLKENSSKVVVTIKAMAQQPDLNNLAVKLMYSIWKKDKNYYHQLEELINMRKPDTVKEHTQSTVTKALFLKQLCIECPHLYGKDLVPRLSKILNDCNNTAGAVPCALAIEGITALCRSGIIDVITTWNALSKKFKQDERVPVIKSLCLLIAAIPDLQYTEAYEHLNTEVVTHLWQYVTHHENEEVVNEAFNALSCFNLEILSASLPEQFLDENVRSIPNQSACVSGTTWINLLSDCQFQKAAAEFLIKLVSTEVENYLKYVYQVKGQGEPQNYKYLPSHSIVRGLCGYLKENLVKITQQTVPEEQQKIYADCLYVLSRKYCKFLPPLDWCFLQELIHVPRLRLNCLELACHQVIISGSARRLVENFLVAYSSEPPQVDEVTVLYRNLDYLANSIQPVTFKPFIENSLNFAIELFNKDPHFLEQLIDNINRTLTHTDVQEINKQSLADVIKYFLGKVDITSRIFSIILECVVNVPGKSQEEICRLDVNFNDTEEFERKTKIRCFLAKKPDSTDVSLNWLNEVFEIGSKNNERLVLSKYLTEVLTTQASNNQIVIWFLDLLGQIQVQITNGCSQKEILYFCDILMLAAICFSGNFALLPENENIDQELLATLFPQGLVLLLAEDVWSNSKAQILEFLYYLNSESAIPKEYQCVFGRALCALRHDMNFSKNLKWMKYLDTVLESS